jgi:two-component system response regulator
MGVKPGQKVNRTGERFFTSRWQMKKRRKRKMFVNAVETLLVEDNPRDVDLSLRAMKKHNLANRVHVMRDGREALRRMKSDEQTKTIPVVILTSSRDERDMIESYRLGVNSYIQKPVEFDKFLECLQEPGLYWLLINQMP